MNAAAVATSTACHRSMAAAPSLKAASNEQKLNDINGAVGDDGPEPVTRRPERVVCVRGENDGG
jgi:hypothetical protein